MGYNPEHYKNNKAAYAAKSKAWRERNKERSKEYRRQHYVENKEANLAYSAEYNLKRKYNLTKDQYDTMLREQGGVCAICKGACTRALAVDHCHTTGKVRGLLCNNCNRGIGHLKECVEILETAIDYLKRR